MPCAPVGASTIFATVTRSSKIVFPFLFLASASVGRGITNIVQTYNNEKVRWNISLLKFGTFFFYFFFFCASCI